MRNYCIKRDFKSLINKPWNFFFTPSASNILFSIEHYDDLLSCVAGYYKYKAPLANMLHTVANSRHIEFIIEIPLKCKSEPEKLLKMLLHILRLLRGNQDFTR